MYRDYGKEDYSDIPAYVRHAVMALFLSIMVAALVAPISAILVGITFVIEGELAFLPGTIFTTLWLVYTAYILLPVLAVMARTGVGIHFKPTKLAHIVSLVISIHAAAVLSYVGGFLYVYSVLMVLSSMYTLYTYKEE